MGLYHTVYGLCPYSHWYWSLYKKLALKKVSESVAFKFPMLHFSQRAIITTIVIMIKMVSLAGGWGSFNPWSCPKDPAVHLISLPFSSFHWH